MTGADRLAAAKVLIGLAVAGGLILLGLLACTPSRAESGIASNYTDHRVACRGYRYDAHALTAAHKTLPCGTMALVTNTRNGRSVVVRIVDRGPYRRGRIVDLTPAGARAIGFIGLAPVKLEIVK